MKTRNFEGEGEGGTWQPKYPKRELPARRFSISYGFHNAHPDIDQAETADQSAHEVVAEELFDLGKTGQQPIVRPQTRQGQNEEDDADSQAEEDEPPQPQSLQPAPRMLGLTGRQHDQHRAARLRVALRARQFGNVAHE